MLWVVFSLLTALSESLKDICGKRSLKNVDEYIVSWSLRFFALPFLIPLLFFIQIPSLNTKFWLALLVSGSLNAVATILYMRAIRHSDLSVTVPMVTFTPLFLLLTSPLIVGEFPRPLGFLGVILIVLGSYTLNIKQLNGGYLTPFKTLLKETGPKLMLLVAFIWSITSNFDKIGVQNSSAIFWAISINVFITLVMLPVVLLKSKKHTLTIRSHYRLLLPVGLFSALTLVFQMTAVQLALVTYVISVKRTSAIVSVLLGHLIFKEKGFRERLTGVIIMVLGVLLISLS